LLEQQIPMQIIFHNQIPNQNLYYQQDDLW